MSGRMHQRPKDSKKGRRHTRKNRSSEALPRKELNLDEHQRIRASLEVIVQAISALRWVSEQGRNAALPFKHPDETAGLHVESDNYDDHGSSSSSATASTITSTSSSSAPSSSSASSSSSSGNLARPDPDNRPNEKDVKSAIDQLKNFVVSSPKRLRTAIGSTTKTIPTLSSFVETMHDAIYRDWQRRRDRQNKHRKLSKDGRSNGGRRGVEGHDRSRGTRARGRNASQTPSSESRYLLILLKALEVLDQLVTNNRKNTSELVSEIPHSLDILVRVFGGVRHYTTTWEGMLVLGRAASVLLAVVSLDDGGRRRFFEAKGGAALLLAVDLVCAVARARKPDPIMRRGFDVSADSWVQLASSVCNLIIEASASDKLINHSNVRALHAAGVFDALCRLLAALMRRQRSTGDRSRGSERSDRSDRSDSDREYSSSGGGSIDQQINSRVRQFPLLHTAYAKKLILALHALVSGQREYQRSFLQVKARGSHHDTNLLIYPLVRELTRAWVTSWLGATVPETVDLDISPDGEDGYLKFCRAWAVETGRGLAPGAEPLSEIHSDVVPKEEVLSLNKKPTTVMNAFSPGAVGGSSLTSSADGMTLTELEAEAKRVRRIASDAYELYACIQLLLSALQFEFDDGKEEVRRALARCSLEKAVYEVAADVGGSALLALRVILPDGTIGHAYQGGTTASNSLPGTPQSSSKSRWSSSTTGNVDGEGDDSQANEADSSSRAARATELALATGVILQSCDLSVARCARWYAIVMDECRELHLYHYDDETCVESLEALGSTLREAGAEAQHIFVNIHGALDQLIQNVNQIDEGVMSAACYTTAQLLHASPLAQRAFLRHGGLRALSDCLQDYNVKIRLLALQSIEILIKGAKVGTSSDYQSTDYVGNREWGTKGKVVEEVRKAGILQHVIQILSEFPDAADVSAKVTITAASVIALCVDDNVTNQQLVSGKGGMNVLYNLLRFCLLWAKGVDDQLHTAHSISASPSLDTEHKEGDGHEDASSLTEAKENANNVQSSQSDRLMSEPLLFDREIFLEFHSVNICRIMENVTAALSNLAFRNQACQDELRRNGTLALCISALCGRIYGKDERFQGLKPVSDMIARRAAAAHTQTESDECSSPVQEDEDRHGRKSDSDLEAEAHALNLGVTRDAGLPGRHLALTNSLLNIIVNAVDANPLNQVAVGTPVVAQLLCSLMGHGNGEDGALPIFNSDVSNDASRRESSRANQVGRIAQIAARRKRRNQPPVLGASCIWEDHGSPLSLIVAMQKVSAMACLLASHLAWDNIVNQMLFATLDRVSQLLSLVESGSDFTALLNNSKLGCRVLELLMTRIASLQLPVDSSEADISAFTNQNDGKPLMQQDSILDTAVSVTTSSSPTSTEEKKTDTTLRSNQSDNISMTNSSAVIESGVVAPSGTLLDSTTSTSSLLAGEDPTGREGINYVDSVTDTIEQPAALGIFSVDAGTSGREEVQLYALMALINMSYHNVCVHNLVNSAHGVKTILHLLGSPAFDVRKAAIFCLGNIVTGHKVSAEIHSCIFYSDLLNFAKLGMPTTLLHHPYPSIIVFQENAKSLAEAGGVLALVSMMNDIDEDEISKKAFTTLTSMGAIAIDVIIGHIAALSIGVDGCSGIGLGLEAVQGSIEPSPEVVKILKGIVSAEPIVDYYCRAASEAGVGGEVSSVEMGMLAPPTEPQDSSNREGHSRMAVVWGMLAKLLPVLNGMVYSDSDVREYVWRHGRGLAVLIHVVTRSLPLELRIVTVYTLANLTQSHNEKLQIEAARLGTIPVLASLLHEVQRNDLSDSDDDGALSENRESRMARRSDTCCVIMQVLDNLVHLSRENIYQLLFDSGQVTKEPKLLESIVRCCVDSTEPELRNEAAGVLLSVMEMAIEENGQMLQKVLGTNEEDPAGDENSTSYGGANVVSTLKLLSESFDSSLTSALKARAGQCIRELEEADGVFSRGNARK